MLTKLKYSFSLLVVFWAIFFIADDLFGQNRRRDREGRGRPQNEAGSDTATPQAALPQATPPQAAPPQPASPPPASPQAATPQAPAELKEAPPVDFQTSLKQGTVPDLVDRNSMPLEVVQPGESQTIGSRPYVPDKVLRYAAWIVEKYDTNRDGSLQREEWIKMPGAPQSIDIDGDTVISLEELIWFIAQYGKQRTLHRPNPPTTPFYQKADNSSFSSFRPLSAPLKPKEEPAPEETNATDSTSEHPIIEDDHLIGDKAPPDASNGSDPSASKESHGESPNTPAENKETKSENDAATATPTGTGTASQQTQGNTRGKTDEKKTPKLTDAELDSLSYEKIVSDKYKPSEKVYYRPLSELRGVPAAFIRKDKNGDGQLTMIEFDPTLSAASLAAFGKIDKNADGVITADEMRQSLQPAPRQPQ